MAPACGREAEIRKTPLYRSKIHAVLVFVYTGGVCLYRRCVGENIIRVACVAIRCVSQPNYFVCGELLHIIVCVCVQQPTLCAESCCRIIVCVCSSSLCVWR